MPLTIISHIPDFINYLEHNKKLSIKTLENYSRFLNKFTLWLKENNLSDLLPHQLTPDHVWKYRVFLSRHLLPHSSETLKKSTQNYYLIALRAFLAYFNDKNISCLQVNDIQLIQFDYKLNQKNVLESSDLEKLRIAPDTQTIIGLRNRAIIETILSTGFKVSNLVKLNRGEINTLFFTDNTNYWLNKYLQKRDDNDDALFINYRSRKVASRRLTVRSIENIIKYYVQSNNLNRFITPESLRDYYISILQNRRVEINSLHRHLIKKIESYDFLPSKIDIKYIKNQTVMWNETENYINKEINWLKQKIVTMPKKYRGNRPFACDCDDCLLRNISSLIVSGKINATEFIIRNNNLWYNSNKKFTKLSSHGKQWHSDMMNKTLSYLKSLNYIVSKEPRLNYGRADIGIISDKIKIFIEIGTVSLFKLWFNFLTMNNSIFILIPSNEYILEFRINNI